MPLFLPPDVMHDLLEGVSHLIHSTVLHDLLKKDVIGLNIINKIFRDFALFSPL